MDYDFFKRVVKNRFIEFLPSQYSDMEVDVKQVQKINGTVDSLYLIDQEKNIKATPTIYLNDMFDHYNKVNDLEMVLKTAADMLVKSFSEAKNCEVDFENPEGKVVFQLINLKQNMELLKNIPYREYLDLAIIYRWVISMEDEGVKSFIINNSVLKRISYTEEDLFKQAIINTKRLFPPTVRSMNQAIRDVLVNNSAPDEVIDQFICDSPADKSMWIIGNNVGINGAISMVYEEKLHDLASLVGSDLYIMPSSIHEVIAVSTSLGKPENFAKMVREINLQEVSKEERLSNEVYYYDRESRKVSVADYDNYKRLN